MVLPADRVDRMEVYNCPLTYAHGTYVMSANRTITTLESTVVVLRTADGVSGYGEICPLGSTYLPSSAAGARAALREVAGSRGGPERHQYRQTARLDGRSAGWAWLRQERGGHCRLRPVRQTLRGAGM